MTDQLHQMTVTYRPEHDRMLLRVSTRELVEFRLWLTRLMVKNLWKNLVKRFESVPQVAAQAAPGAREAVMSMRHQQAVQQSDFSKKHEAPKQPPPPEDEPLLVTGFDCAAVNEKVTRLSLRTLQGQAVNLNLNEELLHALCHLIKTAEKQADWQLGLAMGEDQVLSPGAEGRVH